MDRPPGLDEGPSLIKFEDGRRWKTALAESLETVALRQVGRAAGSLDDPNVVLSVDRHGTDGAGHPVIW